MHATNAQKLSAQPRWYCRRILRQENESWSADREDLGLHVATYIIQAGKCVSRSSNHSISCGAFHMGD